MHYHRRMTLITGYYEQTHTYRYPLRGGVEATARLDRWYVSAPMVDWVAAVEVSRTGTRADHSAVRLHLRSPIDPVRIRKPARVYPPPQIAAEAVRDAIKRRLAAFLAELQSDTPDAATWASKWDNMKVDIRKETLVIIKTRRKSARATYKQKIRRLLRQEQRLQDAIAGGSPTIDSVTDALDVLTLQEGHGGSPLQRVRHAITECTRGRAAAHQHRLFREGGGGGTERARRPRTCSGVSVQDKLTMRYTVSTLRSDIRLEGSTTRQTRSQMRGRRSSNSWALQWRHV